MQKIIDRLEIGGDNRREIFFIVIKVLIVELNAKNN